MQILIGPENVNEALKDSSVVMASYDIGDNMRGLVGVVGPTRMDYATVAARLSYFAESLSRMFGKKPATPRRRTTGNMSEKVNQRRTSRNRRKPATGPGRPEAPEEPLRKRRARRPSPLPGSRWRQMERAGQDGWPTPATNICVWRRSTTTTASAPPRRRSTCTATPRPTPSKPFLAVLDNLERGLTQFDEGDAHRQGMEMICKQFRTVLEKLGVTEIDALGQPFDPARHNAVMHVEDENAGENTVVEVFQTGLSHWATRSCGSPW